MIAEISLAIPAGSHVALLGPSSCGKSTLIEAIARLRDHEGRVVVDGQLLERVLVR